MKRKGWIILGAIVAAVLVGAYAASPMLAFKAMSEAAESGDRAALESHVDFPAVRASLKDQLNARILGAIQKDHGLTDGPFGALSALLGPAIVNQVIDAAVTPDGVAAIVRSGRAPLSDVEPGRAAPPPPQAAPPATDAGPSGRKTRFAYIDANHFRATVARADQPDAPLGWVLERRGLFSWKLIRIELPPA
jgi:hypothetical protein